MGHTRALQIGIKKSKGKEEGGSLTTTIYNEQMRIKKKRKGFLGNCRNSEREKNERGHFLDTI